MNKKRLIFIVVILFLIVITAGFYSTYSLNESGTSNINVTPDMTLNFNVGSSNNNSFTVAPGKNKVFEISIKNPYNDAIQYGIAYSPSTLPNDVLVAQTNNSPASSVGLINSNTTKRVSIIIKNDSSSEVTIDFKIITGYKNGGDLIVPSGYKIVTETYELVPDLPQGDIIFTSFSLPNTRSFTVNPNCTGATVTYDYEKQRYKISNVSVNQGASCSPVYTTKTKNYLNSHVISKAGTTQGEGQVVNENGYRYEGKNPNNYIKFNGELWRIIGVFDESSHGQTEQNLTKIIKNDSIDSHIWDKDNKNNWATSSLYNLLNTYYYNAQDGTNSGYCYIYSNTLTSNCDYRTDGINDYYRPMVKNVTWYLGGYSGANATADSFYTYERSSDDTYYYTDNKEYKTTTGYIGLPYVSDYGYSVLSSSCPRTTKLDTSYSTSECAGSSWLNGTANKYTITQGTTNNFWVLANYNGSFNSLTMTALVRFSILPVLYLDSSVYILSGDGSKSNPYIISMDS